MAFLDFLFGKKEKTEQIPTFTPQQTRLQKDINRNLRQSLPGAFEYLNQLLSGSPEAFEAFEAPHLRAFEEETIPTIAERFSALNGQRSSAFGQQLGKAGGALQENLAAQKAGLRQSAIPQLQGFLGAGMQPSFENIFRPATPGFAQTGAQSLASALPYLLLL